MKYRTISKRVSKWCRLFRLYGMKATQCEERNGKGLDRLVKMNKVCRRIYMMYIDLYVNNCQRKDRERR